MVSDNDIKGNLFRKKTCVTVGFFSVGDQLTFLRLNQSYSVDKSYEAYAMTSENMCNSFRQRIGWDFF